MGSDEQMIGNQGMGTVKNLTVHHFKKPILIYILGTFFVIAPLGNIVLTLFTMGVAGWYRPSLILLWASYISKRDWIWLALVFFAGINLLRARRTSWSVAVGTLIIVSLFNIYSGFQSKSLWPHHSSFYLISLFCTFSVLLIMYFFHYPYLERREDWTGVNGRIVVDLAIQLVSQGDQKAQVVNISKTGVLVKLNSSSTQSNESTSDIKVGSLVQFEFLDESAKVLPLESKIFMGKVVRNENSQFAIQFRKLKRNQKEFILALNKK